MKQNYSIQENYKLITMKCVNDKLIASLKLKFILLFFVLISFNTYAQTRSEFSLADIAEPNSELEFFVIKSSLNITAKEFISDYLGVLNLISNSEMKFVKSHTNEIGIQSSLYQQYVNGYKVIGGEMRIHEQNGRIKYVNGRYMTKQALNSQVNLSEQTALDLALKTIQSKEYLWLNLEAEAAFKKTKKDPNATLFPKGELLFTANSSSTQQDPQFNLCWEYAINVTPQTESYKVYIDATTGEIIKKLPLVYACSTGTCSTLWDGSQSINTSWTGSTFNCIDDCISAQIHTLNGNGNNNGVGATNYTDANNTWPSTQLGKYIGQAHWSMRKTRDYYVNIHAWNGVDDLGHDYISYLNPGFANNAYYSSSTETFSFGGNSDGTSPIISVDIVGHEATHGVIDFNSDLVYEKESGALNESFADIFGETIELYTLGTHDWLIGAEIGYLRSFINPNVKNDPDTYNGTFYIATAGCVPAGGSGGNDFCGVHTNSGVQNFWYYLLTEGGSGTNDNGHAYNVTGIGITKARQIAFATLQNLTTTSGFSNARSVSIQAAKDLYGDCSDEVIQTTNAWRAVGVGSAYIAPAPLNITVSTTSVDVCKGGSITVTAFGASTYSWSNGQGSGNPKTITPSTTTTYTVTGTNAESCTGTKSFTLRVNSLPTVEPSVSDNEICAGQSTTLTPGSNQTINSFLTTLAGGNGLSGNAFDIHAYNSITITDFKMNISSGDSAEVWYNPGGYGNANITSNTGWTKLGATVPITAAGAGNLTTIPTTSNLTISAGSTYGIIVLCNGSNVYTNGTLVGSVESSNSDLYITEGHGGNGGFGAPLNFTLSPRVFNGTVEYKTNYTNYSWAPASTVSSPTSSSTIATPNSSTQYSLTATDGNGCSSTGIVKVYLYQNPSAGSITASPGSICSGESSQLNNFPFLSSSSQNLFTTLNNNNGNEGNVFDIHAINNITINNIRMHILSGDSAQVWYKTSPYGNTNVTSSTGWTKLGNTVAITAAGADALTLIPTTSNLVIPAGSTYGIAVVCNGTNRYLNGTSVGAVAFSSPDLEITEGHGGSGFNGAFIFVNVPRIFNGQIDYTVTNGPMNFLWSPNNTLSSNNIQNPIADPHSTTNYTLTITDAHNCKDTIYKKLYVNPKPQLVMTNTQVLCPGDSAQLGFIADISEPDSLFTTLDNNNANGGNAFDIVTTKPITIKGFKMNLSAGTQVEIWYKSGGYGNANFTGTAGWTKLGSTINVVAAGAGSLTTIIPSTTLSLPAGATYGFMLVANGTVAYTDGLTAVGTTFVSNPDISIRVGHGGTGIGAYSFSSFPRVWNGEVVYDAINSLSSYLWSPNTNMNNAFIANPKVAPLSTTNYSVTVTDINGCTGNGVSGVVVAPLPQLGTATASPTSLCLGGNINLAYTQPAAASCYGGYQGNFAGIYSPSNWTLALV
ncbi:MAG TPA: M4 family metallopeptidase, partial [Chitinophagaceae bacterium]|nr:M4 family metallopeptidase [Chitinophagaceae bacterium]